MGDTNVSNQQSAATDISSFQLPPPPPGSDQWGENPVKRVKGPAFGEGDNTIPGLVDSSSPTKTGTLSFDQLQSLEGEALELGTQLGLTFAFSIESAKQEALNQIGLNPGSPAIPILRNFISLADDMLKKGDLHSALGAQAAEEYLEQISPTERGKTRNTSAVAGPGNADAAAAAARVSYVVVGNPWLRGNAYTAFLVNYAEMLRILKQAKEADGKIQLAGMAMFMELAHNTADTIMEAAKEKQMMYIAQAVCAAVTIAITIGTTAASCIQTSRMKAEVASSPSTQSKGEMKAEVAQIKLRNEKLQGGLGGVNFWQAMQQVGISSGKFTDSLLSAIFEPIIAKYEALKELLSAWRQMAQQQQEHSGDSFKQETDTIAATIQALDQMRAKLQEAIANSFKAH